MKCEAGNPVPWTGMKKRHFAPSIPFGNVFFVTFKVPAVETTVTQYTKRGSKHRQLHMRSALRSPHNESKDVLCFHQFLRPLHKLLRSSLSSKRKKSKRLKTAFSLSVSTAVCLCSCWDARFGFSRHSTGFPFFPCQESKSLS